MADNNTSSNYNDLVQQQQKVQNKKKKCRGNRQLQRYRQKLRNKSIDANTIPELINSNVDMNQLLTGNKKNINKKQFIIKKKKNKSHKTMSMKKIRTSSVIQDSIDYANISDEIFSQILSSTSDIKEKFNCFLNEDEKIKFIRHYTNLIHRLSYIQLQEFQCKYYHYIGITQNIWKGRIAKHLAEKYSICHTYGRSKTMIEQRLKQIEQHLQQTYNAIEQFEHDILSKCIHNNNCFYGIKQLFAMIHQYIQVQQKPLQYEFEYKRKMLILDATDHQLIQKFFNLKPTKSHINIAKRIWQVTMKQIIIEEDIALLEHRRHTSLKSQSTSNLVHLMIDDIDENLKNLNETIETTTCLSNKIQHFEVFKQAIICQAIITSRGMIENFQKMIQIEQEKFSLKNRFMESTSEWQKMVFNAIENRRLHMIERANFNVQHKMVTNGIEHITL